MLFFTCCFAGGGASELLENDRNGEIEEEGNISKALVLVQQPCLGPLQPAGPAISRIPVNSDSVNPGGPRGPTVVPTRKHVVCSPSSGQAFFSGSVSKSTAASSEQAIHSISPCDVTISSGEDHTQAWDEKQRQHKAMPEGHLDVQKALEASSTGTRGQAAAPAAAVETYSGPGATSMNSNPAAAAAGGNDNPRPVRARQQSGLGLSVLGRAQTTRTVAADGDGGHGVNESPSQFHHASNDDAFVGRTPGIERQQQSYRLENTTGVYRRSGPNWAALSPGGTASAAAAIFPRTPTGAAAAVGDGGGVLLADVRSPAAARLASLSAANRQLLNGVKNRTGQSASPPSVSSSALAALALGSDFRAWPHQQYHQRMITSSKANVQDETQSSGRGNVRLSVSMTSQHRLSGTRQAVAAGGLSWGRMMASSGSGAYYAAASDSNCSEGRRGGGSRGGGALMRTWSAMPSADPGSPTGRGN